MSKYPVDPGKVINKFDLFTLLGYEPHEGQLKFHRSRARFRLLCAGSRFGKTLAGAMEITWYMLHPGVRIWTIGPTYQHANKEFRIVCENMEKLGAPISRKIENVNAGTLLLELDLSEPSDPPDVKRAKKSTLEGKSWKEPESLLGEEVDMICLSEGAKCSKMIWERYARARIGSRLGRVIIPTTPAGMDDFLYPLFFEPAMKGDPDYWCGQYAVGDNPHHSKEDIEQARRTLDPDLFAEQYLGQFVHFSGKVFKDFRRDKHTLEPFDIPKHWPRWRGVDPGSTDPFACIWMTVSDDGDYIIYREHYFTKQILSWHAERIKRESDGEHVEYTVIDPSSRQRKLDSGSSVFMQLAEQGIHCIDGTRDRDGRINRIAEFLKLDDATGRPRLFVFRSCPNTIGEFEKFAWAEPKADGRNLHGKTEDKNDHALDAIGYLICTRPRRHWADEKAKPRHSWGRYKEILSNWKKGQGNNVIGGGPPPSTISY